MRQDWTSHKNGTENTANRISSLSNKTTVELRLADQWIGRNTTLPLETNEVNADLERDLFWSLYRRYNPTKSEVMPERIVNKKMVEWLTSGPTWDVTHEMTIANRLASAASSEIMKESLLNDPEVKKMLEEQEKVEQKQNDAQDKEEQAKEQEQNGDAAGAAQSRAEAKQDKEEAEAMGKALSDKVDEFKQSPKAKAMQAGINHQAKDKAQDTNDQMSAWGLEDGKGDNLDIAQLQNTLKSISSNNVERLAELIGRAKGIGMRTLSSRKIAQLVITDAGLTQNFDDIFSDELMMLSDEIPTPIRSIQTAELLDNGLPGIIKAAETKMEGDMVIAVDGSGSMSGDREYLAKALALGITQAANENGQSYKIFTFGSGNEQTDIITPDTDEETKLKWATFLFGGGTDFDMAMRVAIDEVRKMEDPTAADIVMITDGESGISSYTANAMKSLKEETGCRLIVLLVDESYGDIDKLADATIRVDSSEHIEKAAEALSANLWKSGD